MVICEHLRRVDGIFRTWAHAVLGIAHHQILDLNSRKGLLVERLPVAVQIVHYVEIVAAEAARVVIDFLSWVAVAVNSH